MVEVEGIRERLDKLHIKLVTETYILCRVETAGVKSNLELNLESRVAAVLGLVVGNCGRRVHLDIGSFCSHVCANQLIVLESVAGGGDEAAKGRDGKSMMREPKLNIRCCNS